MTTTMIAGVFTFLGMGIMFGAGRVVTSYLWHDFFHLDRAHYLLGGCAACTHCIREWMVCLDCQSRPCLCEARQEAQEMLAEKEGKTND